jgi:hypothetical protein
VQVAASFSKYVRSGRKFKKKSVSVHNDDDSFYLFLQKRQLAYRYIPIGYPQFKLIHANQTVSCLGLFPIAVRLARLSADLDTKTGVPGPNRCKIFCPFPQPLEPLSQRETLTPPFLSKHSQPNLDYCRSVTTSLTPSSSPGPSHHSISRSTPSPTPFFSV